MGDFLKELLMEAFGGGYLDWEFFNNTCEELSDAGYDIEFLGALEVNEFNYLLGSIYNDVIHQFVEIVIFSLEAKYGDIDEDPLLEFEDEVKEKVYCNYFDSGVYHEAYDEYIRDFNVDGFIENLIAFDEAGNIIVKEL